MRTFSCNVLYFYPPCLPSRNSRQHQWGFQIVTHHWPVLDILIFQPHDYHMALHRNVKLYVEKQCNFPVHSMNNPRAVTQNASSSCVYILAKWVGEWVYTRTHTQSLWSSLTSGNYVLCVQYVSCSCSLSQRNASVVQWQQDLKTGEIKTSKVNGDQFCTFLVHSFITNSPPPLHLLTFIISSLKYSNKTIKLGNVQFIAYMVTVSTPLIYDFFL